MNDGGVDGIKCVCEAERQMPEVTFPVLSHSSLYSIDKRRIHAHFNNPIQS